MAEVSSKVGVVDKGDEEGIEGILGMKACTPCCFCGEEWSDATKTAAANANFILLVDLFILTCSYLLLSNGIGITGLYGVVLLYYSNANGVVSMYGGYL